MASSGGTPNFAAAHEFVLREARLIERRCFDRRFGDGSAADVVAALLPYQNPDGGFGNGLEPDLRGAASQPVPLEHALKVLDEAESFDPAIAERGCAWLTTVTTEEGGVPFVLPSVVDGPHAPWWVPTGKASLNPTAGIAGLLHKHRVEHPWLEPATTFCWADLESNVNDIGGDDAVTILGFLEHVGDRERAERAFDAVSRRIVDDLVALDPAAEGYVKSPLEFAPRPSSLARRLFDDATIDSHLDAVVKRQQADGGWPITWEPPSTAAVTEWRGFVTLKCLEILDAYGRLDRQG